MVIAVTSNVVIAIASKVVIAIASKVVIAITSNMLTAQAMISNSPAVVIGFLTFSATIALGTRRVTFTPVSTAAAAAAISATTAATTISATITAAVTTTFFSIGRAHDRQPGRE
ncbi:hypothetical protein BK658_26490 [Pseudomonas brassicacearum]|uniref:Uncharacterized protein n=1 Tax=Pseudomonas brassicacearum TaxID=930166 RepID=A0A423GJ95_9PSED|nr:hypothetical protein BK658_26490 [Pseudomonas brassicacearum]